MKRQYFLILLALLFSNSLKAESDIPNTSFKLFAGFKASGLKVKHTPYHEKTELRSESVAILNFGIVIANLNKLPIDLGFYGGVGKNSLSYSNPGLFCNYHFVFLKKNSLYFQMGYEKFSGSPPTQFSADAHHEGESHTNGMVTLGIGGIFNNKKKFQVEPLLKFSSDPRFETSAISGQINFILSFGSKN